MRRVLRLGEGVVTPAQDGRLGSYRIVSRLGEGGMGVVYRAEHVLLGRTAAVKVLLPELSQNQDMVDRFFTEARATAQLRHPGIVEVFDFGTCADGAAFIVMELLHGESLTSRLGREGRLPWPQACRFARQIASALAAAHRAQIVHRDLKPDNVFLVTEPDQREERTKVLDFGIAKLAGPGAGSGRTCVDLIMGTPAYMSPQQCRGAGQVDHRADIYSLGCILFEMVCGRPPFEGEGFGDLLSAHLLRSPPRPRALAPELPEALEQMILRMLAKSEAERPQSMDAVAAELDAIVETCGTGAESAPRPRAMGTAVGDGRFSRAQAITTLSRGTGHFVTTAPPRRRRSPYAFGAAAVVVAGLVVAVAGGVVDREDADDAPTVEAAAAASPPPVQPPVAPPAPPPRRPKTLRVTALASEPVDAPPPVPGEPAPAGVSSLPGPGAAVGRPGEANALEVLDALLDAWHVPPPGAPEALHPALAALLGLWSGSSWFDPATAEPALVSALGSKVSLTVTSWPPGAEVALDGVVRGKTPLSLTLDRGVYDLPLVLTRAGYGEREVAVSAALDRTEHVVLPRLIARRVFSKPAGAELLRDGEVLGTTPLELELPRSETAEAFTLRLTGHLEQSIEIVPDRAGATTIVLEREPQPVTHELGCDPGCEVILDGQVIGSAAPGQPYRAELLEQKGQWRAYVLRPLDKRYREAAFRAPADRSVTTTIRLPCAPRIRKDASLVPPVYNPYDPCRER